MTIYRNLSYLEKHRYGKAFQLPPPHPNLDFILVIPLHPQGNIKKTLKSLQPLDERSEVLILLWGHPGQEDWIAQQEKIATKLLSSFPEVRILRRLDIPPKDLSQGLLGKLLMDEALHRFREIENKKGMILSLDDGSQLSPNFLTPIHQYFMSQKKVKALSFDFEWPLEREGEELIQRYLIEGLAYANHPHAHFTLGNNFACTADYYEKVGGMNRRKQGSTFYFLQKFISEDRYRLLPKVRLSLPSYLDSPALFALHQVPPFQLFEEIKVFLDQLEGLFMGQYIGIPGKIKDFLDSEGFEEKLEEMKKHSTRLPTFSKRFFAWFNLMLMAKFLQAHAHSSPLSEVQAMKAKREGSPKVPPLSHAQEALTWLRRLTKS